MTPAALDRPETGLPRFLRTVALVLLLSCTAGRCFLNELPYRTSPVKPSMLTLHADRDDPLPPDRTEAARVTIALLLLTAIAMWLLAGGLDGRLVVRRGWLAGLIVVFAGLAMASAWQASNQRDAMLVWLEQVSMLGAAFLAVQLCADRHRFSLAVIVLAGVAGAMALKGLYQVGVEIPERIADFEMYGETRLRQVGWAPGTPQAQMLEQRLRDSAPLGFLSLANVFASLLIVLLAAAGGLAVDRIVAAVRSRRARPADRPRGEVDLPTVAAVLITAAALSVAVVGVLTRSRGGIAAAIVAALAAAVIYQWRDRLAQRWRLAVSVVAIVAVLGGTAVVACGLTRGSLPTKTMAFRWQYWQTSAEIVKEHPLLGVGPGNFATAYMQHRLPGAEEAVKMPHNVVMHALSQYGLPGGACYLAVLVCVAVGLARPRTHRDEDDDAPSSGRADIVLLLLVVAFVVAARATLSDAMIGPGAFFVMAILPAAALAILLAVAGWDGRRLTGTLTGPAPRIALACAVGGMLLHNMVTFTLFVPATATVFWVAAGAALARAGGVKPRTIRKTGPALSLIALAGVVAAGILVWWPIVLRTARKEEAIDLLRRGESQLAARMAEQAYEADPIDPLAAADAARIRYFAATVDDRGDAEARGRQFDRALSWAKRAIRSDPQHPGYWRLAAEMTLRPEDEQNPPDSTVGQLLHHWSRAVKLSPTDHRQRVAYAKVLSRTGRGAECLDQLREAEEINAQLNAESIYRFNEAELQEIERIRGKVK